MFCQRHVRYKEPLDDKRVSHGCCKKCEIEQNKILDEILEKQKRINKFLSGEGKKPPNEQGGFYLFKFCDIMTIV